ncbi:MAG: exo-alpha-sialidase [Succinivibrio sp.]|nr:exo-alpha-sialidase [Succinivibrio sp.]
MLEPLLRTFACEQLPCSMCHSSSLLPLDEHRLLCAFFGGSYEGEPDTAIYLSTLQDGVCVGLRRVAASGEAHWNPVLYPFPDSPEHVGLIYKVGNVISQWRSYVCESTDGGQSFSEAKELVAGDRGGRGPVRNKPLYLRSGRLLFPASLEDGEWRAFVDISDDWGATLHKSEEIFCPRELMETEQQVSAQIAVSAQSLSGHGIIQPSLWEDESGVHMFLRSTVGSVLRSDSSDEGESWCEPYRILMPNNNSGLDADRYHDKIYLVCNPVSGNWGVRTPITLFSSSDGVAFTQEKVLDSEEHAEFSYPCVRVFHDCLYISYTSRRTNIRVLKFAFVN